MDYLLILLHDLLGEFLLLLVALTVFELFVQLLKKFYLCIQLFNDTFFFFDLVFKTVDLVAVEVLELILELV